MELRKMLRDGTPDRKGQKHPVEVYCVRVRGHGVIPIKVYTKWSAKRRFWLVEDRSSGRRRLLNCRSLDAAHDRAKEVAEAIAKGKQALLQLSRRDLEDYLHAGEALQPFGIGVLNACQEYAQAERLLCGRGTLSDAVRFYLNHGGDGITPKTFAEAKDAFLELKLQQSITKKEHGRIKGRLNRLAVRFGDRVLDSIAPGDYEQFLTGLKLAPKTYNHYRKTLSALYNFARVNRYTPKDCNPAKEFKAAPKEYRTVACFSVAQVKQLLASAETEADTIYLSLCGFAGLRPCEAARLRWEMIGTDYLHLPVGISGKKGKPRDVPLLDNLKVWLAPHRKTSGLVLPADYDIRTTPRRLAERAGIVWVNDGLRHGFGTFRYAMLKTVDAVCDEMGNTRGICEEHYINKLVTKEAAEAWFSVMPDNQDIIPMPAASNEINQSELPAAARAITANG